MKVVTRISRWLLYERLGWTKDVSIVHPEKYIICYAPHTSNWDFIIARLYLQAEHFESYFLMKKEWFFWPLGKLFRRMGGIPVFRSEHSHLTAKLARMARETDTFALTITPEGTRSLTTNWRRGFYYIAYEANIPILLYGIDYQRRLIQCTKVIHPSGDFKADMREIKLYYRDFKGKHPENFTIGEL